VGSPDADDFRHVGDVFVSHACDVAGLQPSEDVLEIGCGSGRIAARLLRYLDKRGSYRGFDVHADAVMWCREHLEPYHAGFRFFHADVYNSFYNPSGGARPDEYHFPFADSAFDLVLLASVFTHMLPDDLEHYLREIRRVLRPDGRMLATWFLLDDWSRFAVAAGRVEIPFLPREEAWWVVDEQRPEFAVAYDELYVRRTLACAGLPVLHPIRYGTWCARPGAVDLQDLVLARG
jgi:SAM-dependent methyltransferase